APHKSALAANGLQKSFWQKTHSLFGFWRFCLIHFPSLQQQKRVIPIYHCEIFNFSHPKTLAAIQM
ncbi:hypothetical protein RM705_36085, partial [Streptomyces sp. DSM 41636]